MRIRLRRGTTAQWTAANPTLQAGEPGVDLTTGTLKIGNGAPMPLAFNPAPGIAPLGMLVVNDATPLRSVVFSSETMASSPGTLTVNRAIAPGSLRPAGSVTTTSGQTGSSWRSAHAAVNVSGAPAAGARLIAFAVRLSV